MMMKTRILQFLNATALAVVLCAVASAQEFSADEIDALHAVAEVVGDANAQFLLGFAYYYGKGVAEDEREGVRWFRKAADQGNMLAQSSLGDAYRYGAGVAKDMHVAVRWYRKAAEQGFADSQYWLGNAHYFGEGVSADKHEGVRWYRKAAEQGHADAQGMLGFAYSNGEGVAKDKRVAISWWRKAADQGNALACRSLGATYFNGDGITENKREGVRWHRKAADLGEVTSQAFLGGVYFVGVGVITDKRESYIWLSIAKANGAEGAEEIFRATDWHNELSQSEIRSAQKEAARRLEAIDRRIAEKKNNSAEIDIATALKPKGTNIAERVFEIARPSVVVVVNGDNQGSGVIIRPNVVATNCHVVNAPGKITVYKSDGRRSNSAFSATIRHSDESKDFCLLDVDDLQGVPATVRKYDTINVGEDVYGLGAPQGLDLSLSTGVISQLREVDGNRFIQTDTAISPGSSGGGLFDSDGSLVGIMTGKIADADVEGIGFAIPADLVLEH